MKKLLVVAVVAVLSGCATDASLTGSAPGSIIWQFPKETPSWILVPPEPDGDGVHFLGVSGFTGNETTAKQLAVADALNQLARYVGVNVTALNSYLSHATGSESDALNASVTATVTTRLASETFINKGKQQWYFRRIKKDGAELFEARLLFTVSQSELQLLTDYVDDKQRSAVEIRRLSRETSAEIQKKALADITKSGGIVVIGRAFAPPGLSKIAAEQAAITSAKHDAYLKLNDRMNGAKVVGATTKDQTGNSSGVTSVIQNGHVRAEIVSETVEWENGVPVAVVILRAM